MAKNEPTTPFYPAHGILNKLEKPQVSSRVNLENYDAFTTNKNIVKEFYAYDAVTNTGPYKGIVLRWEGNNVPEAGGWLESWFKNKGTAPTLVKIKVRIPELHAMLPIPKQLGGGNNPDNAIIDMYPTFIAQNNGVELANYPEIASLVWVDYGNKVNFSDPIYLRPVSMAQAGAGAKGDISAQGAHNNKCGGLLQSNPPPGDELAGRNKALSHSGLPLLPRKLSNANIGEGILKGPQVNSLTVSTWQKEMKASGIPGITWIGNIKFNGIEDSTHENNKRETIIFSPNVTDYSAPLELIYFFHGATEFDKTKDFQKRYPAALKRLASDNRNFIFVMPELPWGKYAGANALKNVKNGNVWQGNDNFASFHGDVLATIKNSFSDKVKIEYISVITVNNGTLALSNAFKNGMDNVKPNRLVLTEVTKNFSDLVATAKESIIQVVVKKNSEDEKRFNQYDGKDKIDFKALDKSSEEINNEAIFYIGNKTDSLKKEGQKLPAPKNADKSPGIKEKTVINGNKVTIEPAEGFKENRVYVAQFGVLKGTEDVLVKVPSVGAQQFLHSLAAKRLALMSAAWQQENAGQPEIKIASGWRANDFATKADWEAYLRVQYKGDVEKGKGLKAFESPHSAGLAFDIGNLGLTPKSTTNEQQKQTKLHKWLVNNAYKFGITPYKLEAWHWEVMLPRDSWVSGKEFTDNLAVRVLNPGKGNNLPMASNDNKDCVATVASVMGSSPNNPNGSLNKPASEDGEVNLVYTDFARKKAPRPSIQGLLDGAKKVDQKWGTLIKKYQGNLPYGLTCVRIAHENGVVAKSKPTPHGETGLFQIWCGPDFYQDYVTYGVDEAVKRGNFQPGRLGAKCKKIKPDFNPFNADDNIWGGLSDFNVQANRLAYGKLQRYFPKADVQFWGCVNIQLSIGDGAFPFLLKKVNPTPGNALNELCNYVANNGESLVEYAEKGLFGKGVTANSVVSRVLVTPFWIKAAQQLTGESVATADYGMKSFLNFA